LAIVLVGSVLALTAAGCGGSSSESEEEDSTPAQAIAEIKMVRSMLDEALADYGAGNADQAEQTVGDAYLEHFEKVEHPLEEQDEELMEELEVLISTTIRNEIKNGKPMAEVQASVAKAKSELAHAEQLLASE
jgi:hypothetical protein